MGNHNGKIKCLGLIKIHGNDCNAWGGFTNAFLLCMVWAMVRYIVFYVGCFGGERE